MYRITHVYYGLQGPLQVEGLKTSPSITFSYHGVCVCITEGGIFEARVSPGSFLYLYIFLHLFHMFLNMFFVLVV